jgi:hypothetical protein
MLDMAEFLTLQQAIEHFTHPGDTLALEGLTHLTLLRDLNSYRAGAQIGDGGIMIAGEVSA